MGGLVTTAVAVQRVVVAAAALPVRVVAVVEAAGDESWRSYEDH